VTKALLAVVLAATTGPIGTVSQGRDREMVADHQSRRHHGGV